MKSRCFTQIPKHELVKMTSLRLECTIRKKLVNVSLRDIAQLVDKVKIEQIKKKKRKVLKIR